MEDATASDHIKHVASQRAVVLRMKDEIKLAKANLKVAEQEFELALSGMSLFAEKQMAFKL